MKKTIIALFCLTILLSGFLYAPALSEESGNLLLNGSFENLDDEGLPQDWYTDAFTLAPGYTTFSVKEGEGGHDLIAEINNIGLNDARFAQDVSVEPNSLYCLSGDILAEGIEEGHGANLSIEGVYAFSEEFFDTDGKWEHIEYYGETGPDQDTVTVFARLGGYSGESAGKAYFDNLKLTKVDSVPGDDIADLWFVSTNYASDEEEEDDTDSTPAPAWPFLIALICVYLFAALAAIRAYRTGGLSETGNELKSQSAAVLLILATSFILRLILSFFIQGYMVDVNCFLSWGHTMASVGPGSFYQATNFCDYPPLYTYVLGLNSLTADGLNASTAATRVIFRFVPSLCDVLACWCLYRFLVSRPGFTKQQCLSFLAFLAFNPATILNSAAWGQMDSVLCLALLLVALLAINGKWTIALPLYMLSVLIKPQALMLGPLGLIYIILTWIKEKDKRRQICIGAAISILVFLLGVIPFSPGQETFWIFQLYGRTLASYPYATVNTANFYYLLGGNWAAVGNTAHTLAPILLSVICLAYGTWWYFRCREDKHRIIEAALSGAFALWYLICVFTGASWALIGGTAMAFAFVIVISQAVRYQRIELLTYLGGLLFILLYVFGVKMHERYLFPAILLLAAAWILLRDRRILYVGLLFTATLFLNEGIVLDNSIRLGSELGHLNRDTVWLADLISVLNIAGSVFAVYLSIELCHGRTAKTPGENNKPILPLRPTDRKDRKEPFVPDRSLHWQKKDTVILTTVTALYAVVCLLTLGSTKAPQHPWISTAADEQIVFDLGSEQEDFSILYFAQVSRHDFSFAVSSDGETWSGETWAQMDQGQCWKWKYVTESYDSGSGSRQYYNSDLAYVYRFSGRYVRLTAAQVGLTLNEILFRGSNGETIPARILSRENAITESELYSEPSALLDEQDTLEGMPNLFAGADAENEPAQPSWWNSTYFDEIYHARTAYEFLNGTVPYETSHPPLGKVLMSLFVAIFGMTPFGWRFAGALAGIIMLPGMYLLGKQLTKKTSIATCACLLMALDCLHFTQTQIATIDSFPVLFIIFSYFFMLRYLQTDPYRESMKGILVNLALCGLFMGLAIASKWIGIYAGAGLAILFVWHHIRIFRWHRKQEISASGQDGPKPKDLKKEGKTSAQTRQHDLHRLLVICLWCVLFFVIVPIVIYLISYLPYFAYNSKRINTLGAYISEVWNAQTGMLNYHSTKNLGMDHPFYSPWWEWPIIRKPMYYAAEQYISDTSTVHHSIFCFGNPVIWFGGLAALLYCLARWLETKRYQLGDSSRLWHLSSFTFDPRYAFLFIGGLAQYLPWVLVPRGTYIYHYFASLPFLMLAFSLCFDGYPEKYRKTVRILICSVLLLAAVSFVLFFPYASGINAPAWWLDIGKKILRIWY